jgi:tetratricopeptide (TPR) repeat protein
MMLRLKPHQNHGNLSDPTDEIAALLAKGKTDLAMRKGEETFFSGAPQSPSFYSSLYRLEMNAGKPKMAREVGERALTLKKASPPLLIDMIRDSRDAGDSGRERNLLFQGISLYPNDEAFWTGLIHQDLREGRYEKALATIRLYEHRNPPRMGHPSFPQEEYAALVGLGRGDEADQWLKKTISKNWMEAPHPSLLLAHAVIMRELQKGQWRKAEKVARILAARGIRSKELYRDWMTALGAMGNSIMEAHVGRQAMAAGYTSVWIRSQVAFLAQKGY